MGVWCKGKYTPLTLTHTLTTEFGENEFCENCEFTAPVKIPATTRKIFRENSYFSSSKNSFFKESDAREHI